MLNIKELNRIELKIEELNIIEPEQLNYESLT